MKSPPPIAHRDKKSGRKSPTLFHEVEIMPHTHFLGVHIVLVIHIRLNLNRHILNNFETVRFKSDAFDGVVCHEPHAVHTELLEN